MKIVFIGNTAWSMYNFRSPIFCKLIEEGYKVIVVSPKDEVYQPLLEDLGCVCFTIDIEAKGNNPIRDIKTMYQIWVILKREKPVCSFFYTIKPNIYGGIAALWLHIPYIPVVTGLGYAFTVDGWINSLVKKMYKYAFKKAHQVWFLNQDDMTLFIESNLINEIQAIILPSEGIDVKRFDIKCMPQKKSFLLLARMLWSKGIGEFVDAARLLKKKYPVVSFKLLGFLGVENPDAITKEEMDVWVKEGIVDYLGVTTDVRSYLYDSTCIVLPSFYREGIPFSLMEGAAAARPIITTNAAGCRDVVDDGITGFLCKLQDSDDLAICMERIILMSEDKRMIMGMNGRKKMEKEFDISIVIDRYMRIINDFS